MEQNVSSTEVLEKTDLETPLTVAWILLCSFLVVSMQLGLAMLEVGSVRSAHRMTVLAKNIMDSSISCLAFWVYTKCASSRGDAMGDGAADHLLVFQWAFCASSVTTCSGAMAERTHMLAYLAFATAMAGVIYPVLADSVWGSSGLLWHEFHNRWGTNHDYHDFAGSGVVHFNGGLSAGVGVLLLGRRIRSPLPPMHCPAHGDEAFLPIPGRAGARPAELLAVPESGWPRRYDSPLADAQEFKPLNYLQVIGMFTLWIGWYGFNAGSTLCMSEVCGGLAATVAWNTTLAACAGGLGSYMFCYAVFKHLDTGVICNGILGGLVSVTACCDIATDRQVLLIGLLAGLVVYPLGRHVEYMLRIDDPVEALPIRALCGCFGVLVVAFCEPACGQDRGFMTAQQARFCSPEHSVRDQLCIQLWGLLVEFLWTVPLSFAIWGTFALFELIRACEGAILREAVRDLEAFGQQEGGFTDEVAERLRLHSRRSPTARKILRAHHWSGKGFPEGSLADIGALRGELIEALHVKVDSSLEIGRRGCVHRLVSALHRTPLREIAWIRLRITPMSELSGLGAAHADGGQLGTALQRLLQAHREMRDSNSPLRREVRELAEIVQNQDALLRCVTTRARRSRDPPVTLHGSSALPTVPEKGSAESSPSQAKDAACPDAVSESGSVPMEGLGVNAIEAVPYRSASGTLSPFVAGAAARSPPRAQPGGVDRSNSFSTTATSDATQPDQITPRSAVEETPPPSIIGSHLFMHPPAQPATLQIQEVAGQMISVLQAQQFLLQSLAHSVHNSGAATPEAPAFFQQQQQQLLSTALQRLAHQQLSDGTFRVPPSTSFSSQASSFENSSQGPCNTVI